jgi:hypothetical protein
MYHPVPCVSAAILILTPSFSDIHVSFAVAWWGTDVPRSAMFMTPGAVEVALRFFCSSTPATAESTFFRSDVSADIVNVFGGSSEVRERLLMEGSVAAVQSSSDVCQSEVRLTGDKACTTSSRCRPSTRSVAGNGNMCV